MELLVDEKKVFKSDANNTFQEKITRSLALVAFIEKRMTLAKAAELADKSLAEFIDLLAKYHLPWMEYTAETFNEDRETLTKLRDHRDDRHKFIRSLCLFFCLEINP